ncbi:hypothetical protein BU15DRAFT_80928 [Melanogaster broomeanus]|nr:hypothetical protein BU15DRAFT_80928 [Melanogaster broomeanus]
MTIINAIVETVVAFRLRMYAMWNRNRLIIAIGCSNQIASLGILMFIFFRFLPSVRFGVPPFSLVSGCFMTGASSVLFASFVDVICAEGVTTSLTLYRAYRRFRPAPNVLIQNLTHDGVFHCLCMFAVSVINVVVIFLLPVRLSALLCVFTVSSLVPFQVQYSHVLVMYQGIVHTVFATRMQLHFRKLNSSMHRIDLFSDGSLLPMASRFKPVAPLMLVIVLEAVPHRRQYMRFYYVGMLTALMWGLGLDYVIGCNSMEVGRKQEAVFAVLVVSGGWLLGGGTFGELLWQSSASIFDYLYQLDDELTFIWGRRDWSFGKAICVATRYIPFVLIPITLSSTPNVLFGYLWLISPERISKGALEHHDVHTCSSLLYTFTTINVVAILLSEVAFRLRMYAIWNRSRLILTIICCTLIASVGTLMFIFIQYLPSVTFGEPPFPIIYGCYMTGASPVLFVSFVVIMCVEAVTTSLTLYRAYKYFRDMPNVLIQNLTRDGLFYCLSMFVMSVINVLVIFLLPVGLSALLCVVSVPSLVSFQVQYSQVLVMYQSVMHTILATRMQLHLRKLDSFVHGMDPFSDGSVLPMSSFKPVDPGMTYS